MKVDASKVSLAPFVFVPELVVVARRSETEPVGEVIAREMLAWLTELKDVRPPFKVMYESRSRLMISGRADGSLAGG